MLSIQKSPTDKTGLWYVAPPSDIPSTFKTVFVKPTVSEPPLTVLDKGKDVIGGDSLVTQKPPTIRRPPICHHCDLSGHIQPRCSLLKAQRSNVKKEVTRQVNFSTRPLAQHQAPWHQAPQHQAPLHQALQYQATWHQVSRHKAPRRQAPQHQRHQQIFVPANQNDKLKTNKSRHYMKMPQKMEDDQFYRELPIWM
jgi:hypothetical protein